MEELKGWLYTFIECFNKQRAKPFIANPAVREVFYLHGRVFIQYQQ